MAGVWGKKATKEQRKKKKVKKRRKGKEQVVGGRQAGLRFRFLGRGVRVFVLERKIVVSFFVKHKQLFLLFITVLLLNVCFCSF